MAEKSWRDGIQIYNTKGKKPAQLKKEGGREGGRNRVEREAELGRQV